jgi:hypothetical protein
MYENLPLWMQQGVKTWNKGDVELENGSKIFTSATSTSGIWGFGSFLISNTTSVAVFSIISFFFLIILFIIQNKYKVYIIVMFII